MAKRQSGLDGSKAASAPDPISQILRVPVCIFLRIAWCLVLIIRFSPPHGMKPSSLLLEAAQHCLHPSSSMPRAGKAPGRIERRAFCQVGAAARIAHLSLLRLPGLCGLLGVGVYRRYRHLAHLRDANEHARIMKKRCIAEWHNLII